MRSLIPQAFCWVYKDSTIVANRPVLTRSFVQHRMKGTRGGVAIALLIFIYGLTGSRSYQSDCGRLKDLSVPLPWHVTLFTFERDSTPLPEFSCGGTLISTTVIITAAHCVWGVQPAQLQLGFGSFDIRYNPEDGQVVYFNASQIIVHPLYFDYLGNYGSDIALIEIEGSTELIDSISPICLEDQVVLARSSSDQALGIVVSLGRSGNEPQSEHLKLITIPMISDSKCLERLRSDFWKYLTIATFCAGWANGTGVCNGDSGNGLMIPLRQTSDQWNLHGIVNLSPRQLSSTTCDLSEYAIFTKVCIYLEWIRVTLAEIDGNRSKASNKTFSIV